MLKAAQFLLLLGAVATLAACGTGSGGRSGTLQVTATTTQLGDFVRAVGGEKADVTQILKPNTDPHEYEPRPDDVVRTGDADVVVESGDNLDRWMANLVSQSGSKAKVIDISSGLKITQPGERGGPDASKYDPHWWHDPRNAEEAVREIRDALIAADPDARAAFTQNADAYLAKLAVLDQGIARCFAKVPADQRKLVTDHDAFGYFAARYGLDVVGAVIPSQTTGAQASAGELARLTKLIRAEDVKAVFPESSVNAKLARAIARQTGADATSTLYGDTLGPKGSRGATYLTMEQANADAMVKGFTGGAASCRIAGL